MISSKLKDGEHFYLDRNEKIDEEEKKLLMTQDLKYVMMKLQVEKKVSVRVPKQTVVLLSLCVYAWLVEWGGTNCVDWQMQ